jgi:hypothetical protein
MPLPATWYLKPALLPAAISALAGCALVLIIPDPLWSLGSADYPNGYTASSLYTNASFIYAALIYLFWVALHASCWLVLIRAWRYHAHIGVPILRHAIPLPLFAALLTFTVWLLVSLLLWLGIRSATQDYLQNPWFPLLAQSEYPLPLAWLKTNFCLYLAWLTAWSRWHTPYRQAVPVFLVTLFWHALAAAMLTRLGEYLPFTLPALALLLIITLVPARRQLRDLEAL